MAAVELVRSVKASGRKVAILSNMPAEFLEHYTADAAWFEIFDAIVCSGPHRVNKPGPAIYAAVLRELGVDARNALFIDDVEANVAGAEAASIRSHLYRNLNGMQEFLGPLLRAPLKA